MLRQTTTSEDATVKVTARSVDGNVPSAGFGLLVHGGWSKAKRLDDYGLLIFPSDEPEYEIIMHKDGAMSSLVARTNLTRFVPARSATTSRSESKEPNWPLYQRPVSDPTQRRENYRRGRAGFIPATKQTWPSITLKSIADDASQSESHRRSLQRPHLLIHSTRQFSDPDAVAMLISTCLTIATSLATTACSK